MDRLVLGMHHLNISQSGTMLDGKPNLSHPNMAIDLCGQDSGVDFYWNKEAETFFFCTGAFGNRRTGNTRFFATCDNHGNPKKVLCADGKERVVTLAMTHSWKDFIIGKLYAPESVIYQEGDAGRATGMHIHLEVAEGWRKTKYWDTRLKVYRMKGEFDPRNAFFILDGFTTVVSTHGLRFKHTDSVKVEEKMEDSKKLVEYAKTQIGNSGKKYMDWMGYSDPWCSEFVSYCGYKCGFVPGKMPKAGNCKQAHDFYKPKGQLHKKADYAPKSGDIAYFGKDGTDHTAIVEIATDTTITVIEGNAGNSDYMKSKVCRTVYHKSDQWLWGYANPLTDKEGKPKMKDITKDIQKLAPSYAQGGVVPDEGLELTVPSKGTYLLITGHNSTPSLNTQWIVRTGGNTAFKISGTGTMVSVKVSDKNKVLIKTTAGHPNVYISRLDA